MTRERRGGIPTADMTAEQARAAAATAITGLRYIHDACSASASRLREIACEYLHKIPRRPSPSACERSGHRPAQRR